MFLKEFHKVVFPTYNFSKKAYNCKIANGLAMYKGILIKIGKISVANVMATPYATQNTEVPRKR